MWALTAEFRRGAGRGNALFSFLSAELNGCELVAAAGVLLGLFGRVGSLLVYICVHRSGLRSFLSLPNCTAAATGRPPHLQRGP